MASTLFSGLLQSLEESMESHIIEYRTETNDHPSTPQSVIPERLLTPNPENSSIHFLEMFKNPKWSVSRVNKNPNAWGHAEQIKMANPPVWVQI